MRLTFAPVMSLFVNHLSIYSKNGLLEEWQDSEYAGPEPTLENTSYYVKEPDGTLYFYCGNTKIKMTEHFAENGKSVGTLLEDVIQYSANRCA